MELGPRYEYLERALVLCARLARTPLAAWDEQLMRDHDRLKTVLRLIYGEIALLEAAALQVAVADETHPGYLITSVDGVQFHVPFHLFETLPAAEMLQELAEIAKAVRANESSTICTIYRYGSTIWMITCRQKRPEWPPLKRICANSLRK
jgi:hypothetical protein